MTELIIEVSDHLLRDYVPLQGEVREAMGGKILKFADERYAEAEERHAEAEERHAEEMREAEERCARAEERYAEAEERHAEEMREANARIARELSRHGVDQSIIDQVLSFGKKDGSDDGPSAQQA